MLALIVAAALVGVVLAAGHLSALLAHGGWPRYGLGDVPGLLWRLVQRPAAPEAAWAPVNRGMAPAGGRAWWATFVVLASLVAAPVYCAHRARERRRREMSSEWARPGELRPLRVRGHE